MIIDYTPPYGATIVQACEEALKIARANDATVTFTYNAVTVDVNRKSTVDSLVDEWQQKYDTLKDFYH